MAHRALVAAECSEEEDLESCSSSGASSADEASEGESEGSPCSESSPCSDVSRKPSGLRGKCTLASLRAVTVGAALGLLTLYAGLQVLAAPAPTEPGLPTDVTARMLLESDELAELATEQLMATGRQHGALHPNDRHMVRTVASRGFGNISAMLEKGAPAAARRLDTFYLTREQKAAVLDVVRGMGDRRVQSVGEELTNSLKTFLSTSRADRKSMTNFIVGRMQPKLGQMRQLRDEVIAAPLRRLHGKDGGDRQFGLALNPEELRVVSTYDDGGKWEFDMSPPVRDEGSSNIIARSRRLKQAEAAHASERKRLGVAGGIVEQARVVLDQLTAVTGDAGMDMEVPRWITTVDGHVQPVISDLFGCVYDHLGDPAKMIACPMKFASAGIDVLSGVEG